MEEMLETVLLPSSCRTCMKQNALISLYEPVKIDECSNLQLVELLLECTTIQVSQDDGLPQSLCEDCTKVLHIWFSFRQQANKADLEFKKLFEDMKLNIKVETDNYSENFPDPEEETEIYNENELKLEGNLSCVKCQKTFTEYEEYLKHLESHTTNFSCDYCKKQFHKESSFLKHLRKHDLENPIAKEETQLPLDDLSFSAVIIKSENDVEEVKYQCSFCEMSYPKIRSLKIHMKRHEGFKQKALFICDTCGKEFMTKPCLKRHINLHLDKTPYECKICLKGYRRKDQLKVHMITHKTDKPNVCPHCNKAFAQLCSLKDHIRTHTKETPYLCSECGKGFANSSNLRQHMMRHTGIKQHQCKLCPKAFSTKGQMTSHMSTHSGEHPYKCDTCAATFTKPSSLKKHASVHSGERPYACDSCLMRFRCKDHLKRHYRIHTGEKPYKCKYCTRAFSQSNDLVKHLRSHVGHNIYTCSVCGMGFRLQNELKQHYPIHYCSDDETVKALLKKAESRPPQTIDPIEIKENKLSNIQTDKFMITINSMDGSNVVAINIEPKTLKI